MKDYLFASPLNVEVTSDEVSQGGLLNDALCNPTKHMRNMLTVQNIQYKFTNELLSIKYEQRTFSLWVDCRFVLHCTIERLV